MLLFFTMLNPELENITPAAVVKGQPLLELPKDLYIPPDAMAIFLEAFAGPLDLLLYLIKKQNLDILDIPIAEITRQYMQYIELIHEMQLELAAEYLVMAAMLAEIKSRMLLPRQAENVEEDDPRADLVRRLQEYERFKKAAEDLENMPRVEREFYLAAASAPEYKSIRPLPKIELKELVLAFKAAYERAKLNAHHQLQTETLSIRERMSEVLTRITKNNFVAFNDLFRVEEGRIGVVVTFIAILELMRQSLIEIVQSEPFAPIHLKARGVKTIPDEVVIEEVAYE